MNHVGYGGGGGGVGARVVGVAGQGGARGRGRDSEEKRETVIEVVLKFFISINHGEAAALR
jgi:hypothetical protein